MEPTNEKLWAVYTNSDLTEGRGREYVMSFCRLEATARRVAQKGYVQGSDCPVELVEVLNLGGKRVLPISLINVLEPTEADEVAQMRLNARATALAKARNAGLTEDEIKLLGAVP